MSGEGPAHRVAESDRALAVLDIHPAADGHTLVIPKAHAVDIWDLDPEDGRAVWTLVQETATLLRDRLRPDGLTLFQANRSAGWQHVFHMHVHLVPRWLDDLLIKPWELQHASPGALETIAARLAT